MEIGGFFNEPIEFYHGRVPFIIYDIINQIKKVNGQNSDILFNPESTDDHLEEMICEMKSKRITNWSHYSSPATLSVALSFYINSIFQNEPLITEDAQELLLCAKFSDSPLSLKLLRKILIKLYPGRFRTLLYLIDFLSCINSVSEDSLFRIFSRPLFGQKSLKQNKVILKEIFQIILHNHKAVFQGAILGDAAFFTNEQVDILIRKHLNGEKVKTSHIEGNLSPIQITLSELDQILCGPGRNQNYKNDANQNRNNANINNKNDIDNYNLPKKQLKPENNDIDSNINNKAKQLLEVNAEVNISSSKNQIQNPQNGTISKKKKKQSLSNRNKRQLDDIGEQPPAYFQANNKQNTKITKNNSIKESNVDIFASSESLSNDQESDSDDNDIPRKNAKNQSRGSNIRRQNKNRPNDEIGDEISDDDFNYRKNANDRRQSLNPAKRRRHNRSNSENENAEDSSEEDDFYFVKNNKNRRKTLNLSNKKKQNKKRIHVNNSISDYSDDNENSINLEEEEEYNAKDSNRSKQNNKIKNKGSRNYNQQARNNEDDNFKRNAVRQRKSLNLTNRRKYNKNESDNENSEDSNSFDDNEDSLNFKRNPRSRRKTLNLPNKRKQNMKPNQFNDNISDYSNDNEYEFDDRSNTFRQNKNRNKSTTQKQNKSNSNEDDEFSFKNRNNNRKQNKVINENNDYDNNSSIFDSENDNQAIDNIPKQNKNSQQINENKNKANNQDISVPVSLTNRSINKAQSKNITNNKFNDFEEEEEENCINVILDDNNKFQQTTNSDRKKSPKITPIRSGVDNEDKSEEEGVFLQLPVNSSFVETEKADALTQTKKSTQLSFTSNKTIISFQQPQPQLKQTFIQIDQKSLITTNLPCQTDKEIEKEVEKRLKAIHDKKLKIDNRSLITTNLPAKKEDKKEKEKTKLKIDSRSLIVSNFPLKNENENQTKTKSKSIKLNELKIDNKSIVTTNLPLQQEKEIDSSKDQIDDVDEISPIKKINNKKYEISPLKTNEPFIIESPLKQRKLKKRSSKLTSSSPELRRRNKKKPAAAAAATANRQSLKGRNSMKSEDEEEDEEEAKLELSNSSLLSSPHSASVSLSFSSSSASSPNSPASSNSERLLRGNQSIQEEKSAEVKATKRTRKLQGSNKKQQNLSISQQNLLHDEKKDKSESSDNISYSYENFNNDENKISKSQKIPDTFNDEQIQPKTNLLDNHSKSNNNNNGKVDGSLVNNSQNDDKDDSDDDIDSPSKEISFDFYKDRTNSNSEEINKNSNFLPAPALDQKLLNAPIFDSEENDERKESTEKVAKKSLIHIIRDDTNSIDTNDKDVTIDDDEDIDDKDPTIDDDKDVTIDDVDDEGNKEERIIENEEDDDNEEGSELNNYEDDIGDDRGQANHHHHPEHNRSSLAGRIKIIDDLGNNTLGDEEEDIGSYNEEEEEARNYYDNDYDYDNQFENQNNEEESFLEFSDVIMPPLAEIKIDINSSNNKNNTQYGNGLNNNKNNSFNNSQKNDQLNKVEPKAKEETSEVKKDDENKSEQNNEVAEKATSNDKKDENEKEKKNFNLFNIFKRKNEKKKIDNKKSKKDKKDEDSKSKEDKKEKKNKDKKKDKKEKK